MEARHLQRNITGPLPAREAYDAFANSYDSWKWQQFWHRNEWPYIDKLIASAPTNSSILDVGAGTGFYLGNLRDESYFLCGVDISFEMLKRAKTRLGSAANLMMGSATSLPFRSGSFDVVLIIRVASHVADLDILSAELMRVLRPRGRLIVSDIAPEHDYPATEFRTASGWVAVETHKHSIDDWQRTRSLHRLRPSFSTTISASNAEWLPTSFTSIDRSGRRPISFVLAFDND